MINFTTINILGKPNAILNLKKDMIKLLKIYQLSVRIGRGLTGSL